MMGRARVLQQIQDCAGLPFSLGWGEQSQESFCTKALTVKEESKQYMYACVGTGAASIRYWQAVLATQA